jgi:hypothetical protein
VLIYLFRDEGTDNLALTVDVTGQNIPPITPSTDWLFVEAIDTLRFPPPWDPIDFQCLLRRLRADGFCLCGRVLRTRRIYPAGWAAYQLNEATLEVGAVRIGLRM